MKTIRDLLKENNLDLEAPDYVLDYEIGEDDEYFGELSEETTEDGKTIYVFHLEGEVEGEPFKHIQECILDLNEPINWGRFSRFDIEEESAYTGVQFNKDGSITEFRN